MQEDFSIPVWPARSDLRKVPAMATYFNHMNLYHISYAAFPPDGGQYIRARRYMPETGKGLDGTALEPDYYPKTLFRAGRGARLVPHDGGLDRARPPSLDRERLLQYGKQRPVTVERHPLPR
jgi:hypothetical protein